MNQKMSKEVDGKIKTKGKIKLGVPYHHNSTDKCRLILEPIKHQNLMILTTFSKEKKR